MDTWKRSLVVPKAAWVSLFVTGRENQICVQVVSRDG